MAHIDPTAIVDPTAQLADSVRIGPYCVIGPEVSIGDGTVLHNHVTIQALTTLGRENMVYPFSVIGADPQDRKFNGERATCVIGDRNSIREHVTIHRGTANGGGVTRLGSDNLIMVAAHIAHDCKLAITSSSPIRSCSPAMSVWKISPTSAVAQAFITSRLWAPARS